MNWPQWVSFLFCRIKKEMNGECFVLFRETKINRSLTFILYFLSETTANFGEVFTLEWLRGEQTRIRTFNQVLFQLKRHSTVSHGAIVVQLTFVRMRKHEMRMRTTQFLYFCTRTCKISLFSIISFNFIFKIYSIIQFTRF